MKQIVFKTPEEVKIILRPIEEESIPEAIKEATMLLAPAEAYVNWYKDSGKYQVLAEEEAIIEKEMIGIGMKIIESKLERKARCKESYKEAQEAYYNALELRIYLRNYIEALKMQHESRLTDERKVTAEIKAGIYDTGS